MSDHALFASQGGSKRRWKGVGIFLVPSPLGEAVGVRSEVFLTRAVGYRFLGFLRTRGLDNSFWGHDAKNENLAQNVAQRGIAPDGCPFIAVHRRALIDFDVIPRVIIAEALKERGLFTTVEDAVRFSLNPNAWRVAKLLFSGGQSLSS